MSLHAHILFRATHPSTANFSSVDRLATKLKQRGVVPTVSLKAESAFEGEGIVAYSVIGEGKLRWLGRQPLGRMSVIVNRLGRVIRKEKLPHAELLPPTINENDTRLLAHNKHRVAAEVFAPLGIGIPTVLPKSAKDIALFLETHEAPTYIVKPNNGTDGIGVRSVAREFVGKTFAEDKDLYRGHLLQPKYNFTDPLPSMIQPYSDVNREDYNAWNRATGVKEIRNYAFLSPADAVVYSVARGVGDDDTWWPIDQQSVPNAIQEQSIQVVRQAAEVSGAQAMLAAVDYGYDRALGDRAWQPIELNGKAPYLIGYDKHYQTADHLRDLLADMLQQTAAAAMVQ